MTTNERYAADFAALRDGDSSNGSAWLRGVRERGLSEFERLGFPDGTARQTSVGSSPTWRLSPGRTFAFPFDDNPEASVESSLARLVPWSDDWARLVFVDGRFSESLSTTIDGGGLRLVNLGAALHKDGDVVRSHLGTLAPSDGDGFTAVNTAFLSDGALVQLPADAADTPVVHLVWVTTERAEADRDVSADPGRRGPAQPAAAGGELRRDRRQLHRRGRGDSRRRGRRGRSTTGTWPTRTPPST